MFPLERQLQENYWFFGISRIRHRVIQKTYTTGCFSQMICHRENSKYKNNSSWKGNARKIINFSVWNMGTEMFRKLKQQCVFPQVSNCKIIIIIIIKHSSWRDNPRNVTNFCLFWGLGTGVSKKLMQWRIIKKC